MSDYGERLKALRKARYPDFSEDMDMHDITDGISWMADRIKELEAQVKEDALQYLSDTGQMGETIGDLKDQLAKAIEALRITDKWLRELDMYASPDYHLVPSLQKVRDTLKELTGGKDE